MTVNETEAPDAPLVINFDKAGGLITAVAQDYKTKEVLMVAYMNKEAFQETVKSGTATYFSRSRNKLWKKGESSRNFQRVKEILVDCDQDALVLLIDQIGGAACHTGYNTCFYRKLGKGKLKLVDGKKPQFDPAVVYEKKK
ncbi:Phosphoribosyl-AMP cyclohydrolase [uncultured archaeon]|nr:Phosphoribosyl-AMP cyclohydrolase [uncultured archaeon]